MLGRMRNRTVEFLRRSADRGMADRNWARAVALYRRILWLTPNDASLWVQLGHARKERGELAEAERAYRRSLALERTADAWLHLGHLLKRQGSADEAVRCLEEAAARALVCEGVTSPVLFDARIGLGDIHRDRRNWRSATTYYDHALSAVPHHPAIWIQLGHVLKEQDDLAQSEMAYRSALRWEPSSVDALLHLGHVLRRQGQRTEAIAAYRRALQLAPGLTDASQSILAAVGHSPAELLRLDRIEAGNDEANQKSVIAVFQAREHRFDIIWFANIEWHFRMQRPQHLALALADLGVRIAYVSMLIDSTRTPSFRVIGQPHGNIVEVRLGFQEGEKADIDRGLSGGQARNAVAALAVLQADLGMDAPVILAEEPSWEAVMRQLPRSRLVYDCVDLLSGFEGVEKERLAAERRLLQVADVVVTTSMPLMETLANKSPVLIRNGVAVEDFRRSPGGGVKSRTARLGYWGAVREWFAFDWLAYCAERHADWTFEIVGKVEQPLPPEMRRANITFHGERPYRELADMLGTFDVALIPFRVSPLIFATNPVKLYEYLAAGKPVVATSLPETRLPDGLVYLADDRESFERGIIAALEEDVLAMAPRRIEWATQNSWQKRAHELLRVIGQG